MYVPTIFDGANDLVSDQIHFVIQNTQTSLKAKKKLILSFSVSRNNSNGDHKRKHDFSYVNHRPSKQIETDSFMQPTHYRIELLTKKLEAQLYNCEFRWNNLNKKKGFVFVVIFCDVSQVNPFISSSVLCMRDILSTFGVDLTHIPNVCHAIWKKKTGFWRNKQCFS